MKDLIWAKSAVKGLTRIRKFLAKESPSAAKRAAEAILNASQSLRKNPNVGKPVIDLPPYRDLFIRFGAAGYVMRYRVHLDTVYVVHLRHYREDDFD